MSHQLFVSKTNTGDPLCKLILKCIADCLDIDGNGSISINDLIDHSECSENLVRQKIKDLENLGIINVTFRTGQSPEFTLVGYKDWIDLARSDFNVVPLSRTGGKHG